MAGLPAQVDWSQLPHNPLGFFGLAPQFDRRALKRAYGSLIKFFRPETHPAEFQRIRAAYELLESQQRYGTEQRAAQSQLAAWNELANRETADPSVGRMRIASSDPTSAPRPTALADPSGAYQALRSASHRSPQDYLLLAVLADVVNGQDSQKFLKWLLTGIKDHPTDRGIQWLLREYLRTDLPIEWAESTLLTLSKLVSGAAFYLVTEGLWLRLLRQQPFDRFKQLLKTCEDRLRLGDVQSRVAFDLALLRAAVWVGDEAWIASRLQAIERHGATLPAGLANELDFVARVVAYRRQAAADARRSEPHKKLDGMLRDYCMLPWHEGMASVMRTFDDLARDTYGLSDAFSAEGLDNEGLLLELCHHVTADVIQQMGLNEPEANSKRLEKHADAAVGDLAESVLTFAGRLGWLRWRTLAIPFFVLVAGIPVLLSGLLPLALFWKVAAFLVPALLIGYFAYLKPFVLERAIGRKFERAISQEYSNVWRNRLMRYVQAGHAPMEIVMRQFQKSAIDLGEAPLINLVIDRAMHDPALYLLAMAKPFVR